MEMNFWEWVKVIGNIVGSVGGIGAIIAWSANWWGNRIAEKISNAEKAKHEQELERLKAQLESAKMMIAKYNEEQFTLYNQLWSSLFKLRSIGDELWNRAEKQKLIKFIKQLKQTKDAVEKGSLFIEDGHYRQLHEILDAFSKYQDGKNRLIELRELGNVQDYEIQQIVANRHYLDQYTQLIYEMRNSFRRQLNVQIH
ncbi:MAG: hypothetical protein C4586_00735 [Anaerolineaceae bacterium]|nr:MAG: hypothetical protein C4586_00735 [Anaerolineaceae bacterium]